MPEASVMLQGLHDLRMEDDPNVLLGAGMGVCSSKCAKCGLLLWDYKHNPTPTFCTLIEHSRSSLSIPHLLLHHTLPSPPHLFAPL